MRRRSWMKHTHTYTHPKLHSCLEHKLVQALCRSVERFLTKQESELWLADPISGIYPEKIIICKDNCIPIFIIALLTTATTQKQSMSIQRCVDKQPVEHTYNRIPLGYKIARRTAVCNKTGKLEIIMQEVNREKDKKQSSLGYHW